MVYSESTTLEPTERVNFLPQAYVSHGRGVDRNSHILRLARSIFVHATDRKAAPFAIT